MKIAITGTTGRLGGTLAEIYGADRQYQVAALNRKTMDLQSESSIRGALDGLDFDVLINPAALTSVDLAEENPARAEAINARAPEVLAKFAKGRGARFIHISTDYVFDGRTPGLRTEEESPNPLNNYGKSKWEGEQRVLSVCQDFLVIRTSWIFGPSKPSFLDSILDRARSTEGIAAISDKFSTPTSSLDFARYLEPLLAGETAIGGTLHLSNAGSCSWQEYGQVAIDAAIACGIKMATSTLGPISVNEMPGFVGTRPIHSAMSVEKYAKLTGLQPRPWQEAVREHVQTAWIPRMSAETNC